MSDITLTLNSTEITLRARCIALSDELYIVRWCDIATISVCPTLAGDELRLILANIERKDETLYYRQKSEVERYLLARMTEEINSARSPYFKSRRFIELAEFFCGYVFDDTVLYGFFEREATGGAW